MGPDELGREKQREPRVLPQVSLQESLRLGCQSEQPLEACVLQDPWGLSLHPGQEVECGSYADQDRPEAPGMARHPQLLLRATEGDEHDPRPRRIDGAGDRRILLSGELPVRRTV